MLKYCETIIIFDHLNAIIHSFVEKKHTIVIKILQRALFCFFRCNDIHLLHHKSQLIYSAIYLFVELKNNTCVAINRIYKRTSSF